MVDTSHGLNMQSNSNKIVLIPTGTVHRVRFSSDFNLPWYCCCFSFGGECIGGLGVFQFWLAVCVFEKVSCISIIIINISLLLLVYYTAFLSHPLKSRFVKLYSFQSLFSIWLKKTPNVWQLTTADKTEMLVLEVAMWNLTNSNKSQVRTSYTDTKDSYPKGTTH